MSDKYTSRDTLAVNDAIYSEVVHKPARQGNMTVSTPKAPKAPKAPTIGAQDSDHTYDLPQDHITPGGYHPFESWIYDTTVDDIDERFSIDNGDTDGEDTGNEDLEREDTANEDTDSEGAHETGDDIDIEHLPHTLRRGTGRSRTPSPANTTQRRLATDEDDMNVVPTRVVGCLSPAHLLSSADRKTQVEHDRRTDRKTQYERIDLDNNDVQRRNRTPMPLPTDRNSTDSSSQNGASHNPSNTEVPLLISSCIKFLSKAPNISQEGIFRECGGADEVKTLTDGFARGVDMLGGAADVSAHAAASCLKQFLRQRTDTVLGTNNYADWIGVACLRKHDEKLKAARRILATSMSSDNLNILYTLIPFLRNVTDYTEKNRMTLSALATVFGPTLLAPPAGTDLLSQKADVDAGIKIVELLVSEQDTLLNDLPSPAPTHERESNIYDEVECAATPLRHARTPDLEKAPDAVPVDNERERRAPRAATEVLQRSAEQRTSPVVDANGNYTVVLSRTTEESFGVDFETLDNDFKVVCWVTKGGLADGRVAVDDTILAINGFECRRWTHATIVDVLKTASTIELSMAKIPEHTASAEAKRGSHVSHSTPEPTPPPPKKQRSLMNLFRPRRKKATRNANMDAHSADTSPISPSPAVFDDGDRRPDVAAPTATAPTDGGAVQSGPRDTISGGAPGESRPPAADGDAPSAVRRKPSEHPRTNVSYAVSTSDVGNPASPPVRSPRTPPATTTSRAVPAVAAPIDSTEAARGRRALPAGWQRVALTVPQTRSNEALGVHLVAHNGWHALGKVTPGSLAHNAGARVGDVLVTVNGMDVSDRNISHQACVDVLRVAVSTLGTMRLVLELYRPDKPFLIGLALFMERVQLAEESPASPATSSRRQSDATSAGALGAGRPIRPRDTALPKGATSSTPVAGTTVGGAPDTRRPAGTGTKSGPPVEALGSSVPQAESGVHPADGTLLAAEGTLPSFAALFEAYRAQRSVFLSAREELEMLEALDTVFRRGIEESTGSTAEAPAGNPSATPTGRWEALPGPAHEPVNAAAVNKSMQLVPSGGREHQETSDTAPTVRRPLYYDDDTDTHSKGTPPPAAQPAQHRRFVYHVPVHGGNPYGNGGVIVHRDRSHLSTPPTATPDDFEDAYEYYRMPPNRFVDRSKLYHASHPDDAPMRYNPAVSDGARYRQLHHPAGRHTARYQHHAPRDQYHAPKPVWHKRSVGRERMMAGLHARRGRSPYD
eukprot:m.135386 g.135386  ORF g.135386 m.135386 type:complete len:1238 (+) comp17555_c0_seq55:179-3892(+)